MNYLASEQSINSSSYLETVRFVSVMLFNLYETFTPGLSSKTQPTVITIIIIYISEIYANVEYHHSALIAGQSIHIKGYQYTPLRAIHISH